MWAHLERRCRHGGVVRVFADGVAFGDPYAWACSFWRQRRTFRAWLRRDRPDVELCGVTAAPGLAIARAVTDALGAAGFGRIVACQAGRQVVVRWLRGRAQNPSPCPLPQGARVKNRAT